MACHDKFWNNSVAIVHDYSHLVSNISYCSEYNSYDVYHDATTFFFEDMCFFILRNVKVRCKRVLGWGTLRWQHNERQSVCEGSLKSSSCEVKKFSRNFPTFVSGIRMFVPTPQFMGLSLHHHISWHTWHFPRPSPLPSWWHTLRKPLPLPLTIEMSNNRQFGERCLFCRWRNHSLNHKMHSGLWLPKSTQPTYVSISEIGQRDGGGGSISSG